MLHHDWVGRQPFRQALFTLQISPGKIAVGFPANQEVAGPLGQLGEVDGVIVGALLIDVDAGLGAHKADIGVSGDQGSHNLVGACPVDQLQVESFILKIPQFNGGILGA